MTEQKTNEYYLLLPEEELRKVIQNAVSEPEHKTTFNPEPYRATENTELKALRKEQSKYYAFHKRKLIVQAFLLPAFIFAPGTIAYFTASGILSATLFTLCLMGVITYTWLSGKVHQYKVKQYAKQLELAQRAASDLINTVSAKWVAKRYALPSKEKVTFSNFSDVIINDIEYGWFEVTDDQWQLFNNETKEEAPLR